ncbi:MAG: hypothetical protein BJ554DRAFT_8196 [Olpidium bornovanus]|uniref:Uncharacterized protein n=1 Tax=Olpidium bornovanus TaxID=278681 RepID=A0A8H7ZUQ3_9FUNG|nr:MAG: hypothetical protein BJ554DRAFT_8196 [Olpidium bornovanus]
MAQSLREIFEQSRRQLASHAGQNGVPSVTRDLGQIDILSKKLVAGSAAAAVSSQAEGVPDAKAHYFLANAGVNTGELAEAVGNVDLRQTFEPLEPIHETDIQGFLRHEREQIIVSTIEETRRNTLRDFEELFKRTSAEWEKEKERPSVSFRSSMQTSMRASQGAAGPMASQMPQSGVRRRAFAIPGRMIHPMNGQEAYAMFVRAVRTVVLGLFWRRDLQRQGECVRA